MIRLENHLGVIEISQPYFASLIGNAASSCFGVAGMANSNVRQGLRSVFKRTVTSPTRASTCERTERVLLLTCTL